MGHQPSAISHQPSAIRNRQYCTYVLILCDVNSSSSQLNYFRACTVQYSTVAENREATQPFSQQKQNKRNEEEESTVLYSRLVAFA